MVSLHVFRPQTLVQQACPTGGEIIHWSAKNADPPQKPVEPQNTAVKCMFILFKLILHFAEKFKFAEISYKYNVDFMSVTVLKCVKTRWLEKMLDEAFKHIRRLFVWLLVDNAWFPAIPQSMFEIFV